MVGVCYKCAVPGKEELRYETPVQYHDEEKRRIVGLGVRLAWGPRPRTGGIPGLGSGWWELGTGPLRLEARRCSGSGCSQCWLRLWEEKLRQ